MLSLHLSILRRLLHCITRGQRKLWPGVTSLASLPRHLTFYSEIYACLNGTFDVQMDYEDLNVIGFKLLKNKLEKATRI